MSKEKFIQHFDHLPALYPIQGAARAALYNGLNFPSSRDEQWKYTRTAALIDAPYTVYEDREAGLPLPDTCRDRLVFVNGRFAPALSTDLPTGVRMQPMADAKGDLRDRLIDQLGSVTRQDQRPFETMNTAYFTDGALIEVEAGCDVAEPIMLVHVSTGESSAVNLRHFVSVLPGAKATFIQYLIGHDNAGSFTNCVNEITVGAGGAVDWYLIENEGTNASAFTSTSATQDRDSQFSMFTVSQDQRWARNNLSIQVAGEGCETHMHGLYFTRDDQHIDNHTFVDHQVPNCQSNERYKGVMSDRSTGVFNGKIMVRKDAQKTNAFQSNQNVLLSDRATVNTKPELEIYADDVKCSHGCTVGQLDEEALFYLQSRGLSKDAAHRLLVQAFAADVLDQVRVPVLKEALESFIESRFQ